MAVKAHVRKKSAVKSTSRKRNPGSKRVPGAPVQGRRTARCGVVAEDLSVEPGRKLYAEGQPQDVSRGLSSILSQLIREGRLSVVETFAVSQPRQNSGAEIEGHGSDDVLVITTASMRTSIFLPGTCPMFLCRAQERGSGELLRYEKTIVTRGALAKIEELLA
jgi:hypothetical protein